MSEWIAALHHGFLQGLALLDAVELEQRIVPLARDLVTAEQRFQPARLHVHHEFPRADTGAGPFIVWANRARSDPRKAPLLELMLRRLSGPFVTELPGPVWAGVITPDVDREERWLVESLRCLLGCWKQEPPRRPGLVAFSLELTVPPGPPRYLADSSRVVFNWRRLAELDDTLCRDEPERSTLQVLDDAARQVGDQLVVLETARRSAERWRLDCAAHELHRAILHLPVYAEALRMQDSAGQRMSREEAADRYHQLSTIPMSRESGAVTRSPSRMRERCFKAGSHGLQFFCVSRPPAGILGKLPETGRRPEAAVRGNFFDMHAKPGNLTRVHIWVAEEQGVGGTSIQRIYLGHCGKHLS